MTVRTRLLVALVGALLVAGVIGVNTIREDEPRRLRTAAAAPSTTTSSTTSTTAPPPTTTAAPAPPTTAAPVAATGPQAPTPGATPAEVAAQIVAAEQAIANPATAPDALAAAAHLQQVAYRQVVANPSWKDAVIAGLPEQLRSAADLNITAGLRLRAMHTKLRDTLPKWKIVAPAPPEELLGYYKAAEAEFGVPWQYLAGINLVETRMGRIRGVSSAGAQGPMQFMPATWAAYGEGDINSNRDAIRAAARYLKRNGAPHDMRNALWNYNHDHRYVDAVLLYGDRMASDSRAYLAYHGWQVYYLNAHGDHWLFEGWDNTGE